MDHVEIYNFGIDQANIRGHLKNPKNKFEKYENLKQIFGHPNNMK